VNDLLRRVLFLPEQGSAYARSVDHLHYFVIIATMLGAAAVFTAAAVFMVRYRRRRQGEATARLEPRRIHEVLFVGLPLALFLTWFAIGFPQYVSLQTPPRDAMDVYVQAKKWMWEFAYPGGPNSTDVLRVPAGRPVRLLLTSRDVIHSFFVPAFRLKQDVLPGRYTQTWFLAASPGRHQIFCAEYCGVGHSAMLGEVVVMKAEEFDAWIADQRRGLAQTQDAAAAPGEALDIRGSLLDQGRRLAGEYGCFGCHTVDGSRHIGPTWLDLYGKVERLEGGKTVRVDEAYLTRSIMDPRADIVLGYQPVMPTFQGRVAAPEIAAIVEFIKSLRTDVVAAQPSKGPVYVPVPGK
jgi:cytochrome c oxidase subunit 2